jgi:hypothetical protein
MKKTRYYIYHPDLDVVCDYGMANKIDPNYLFYCRTLQEARDDAQRVFALGEKVKIIDLTREREKV